MQDTPEFPQIQARFFGFNKDAFINGPPAITDANQVATISRVFEEVSKYFSESDYRKTLTIVRKRAIEGQINNIISQFDQIQQSRANGTFPSNAESYINNIQSYLDDIDLKFSTPYQTYLLQGGGNIGEVLSSARAALDETERAKEAAQQTLQDADLLVGDSTDIIFANMFQRLVNGKTVKENEEQLQKTPIMGRPLWKFYGIVTLIAVIIVLLGADNLMNAIHDKHNAAFYIRIGGLALIPLAAVSAYFHDWLNRTRPGGYERAAVLWMVTTIFAVVVAGVYAAILILGLGPHPGWDDLVPKIISLLAPAYFIRLCVRNYRASKHLSVMNTHRATVAQAVRGFAGRLEETDATLRADSLKARGAIFLKASELVFDPGETGFISRSEGAGTSDTFFDGMGPVSKQ